MCFSVSCLAAVAFALAEFGTTVGARKQEFLLDIPRVREADLRSNMTLRTGLHAYVLVDKPKWEIEEWKIKNYTASIPYEWVDFYDRNLDEPGKKPYLFNMKDASQKYRYNEGVPRYMQLRLSLKGWKEIKKAMLPKPLPDIFWDEEEWISDCMRKDDSSLDEEAIDNFYTTMQWKFLLIGEKNTRMFLHKDKSCSPSWQVQLRGRKRWTICPNTESRFLNVNLDTFSKRALTDPAFSQALCGQVTVNPGELIYYPGYWWHHTLQLDRPTIAYTGALVGTETNRNDIGPDRRGHASFLRDMQNDCKKCWQKGKKERICDDISKKWPGAAPPPLRRMCEEYLPKCFRLWDQHAKSLAKEVKKEL